MAKTLIVDDSPTMRNLVKRVLELSGHQVTEAQDGVSGLAAASENDFDVVVADINMPRMDGFQMISNIRDEHAKEQLPIVVLTTETSDTSKEKMRNIGASAWVAKPFDDKTFLRIVEQFTA